MERWFAELTNRKLRRSAHRGVTELEAGLRQWTSAWNKDPGHSCGPRPLTRSLTPSPPTASELTTPDIGESPPVEIRMNLEFIPARLECPPDVSGYPISIGVVYLLRG